eukprot:4498779-Alexandrium_andersonii.AAC.1
MVRRPTSGKLWARRLRRKLLRRCGVVGSVENERVSECLIASRVWRGEVERLKASADQGKR